jgi:predicted ATPase
LVGLTIWTLASPTLFPAAVIEVIIVDGFLELAMRQHGLLWSLATSELSDGTLRYLLLVTALLSPRPPELMVLNEPEASLHPELLPALARLIARLGSALRSSLCRTRPIWSIG